ncbi:DedA family protein [Microbacterium sp. NIBRBAC000506063]|uniref:DedA family protein n=1 Tax=Microbacterium sp. NIBRBAC000506063 TaxID=2734618 RepID=UPI001BB74E0C|nr:DedA family protein [Microbacterium sp. NIBRBAC000506063]QTV79037.1 DedA family protein [Microbacterium sp. NIBRBAC000506063]
MTVGAVVVRAAAEGGYDGFIGWVLSLMESLGEVGVGIAVLIETFVPPIPSEALLPGAGFLAYEGRMSFWGAWLAATLGVLVGALIWYAIGAALGRDRTRRLVGRIPLMGVEDFDKAEVFFQRWGGAAVLFGRCVPLVRSFISIPAGIERMPLVKFTGYTFIGSAVWNGIWVGLGYAFGPAIAPILERWSGVLSSAVLAVVALLFLWFVAARLLKIRRTVREAAEVVEAAEELADAAEPPVSTGTTPTAR